MNLCYDRDTDMLVESAGARQPVTLVLHKLRSVKKIVLRYLEGGVVVDPGNPSPHKLTVKTAPGGTLLMVVDSWTKGGSGTTTTFTGYLSAETAEVAALFTASTQPQQGVMELFADLGTEELMSQTVPVVIHHNVTEDDDSLPSVLTSSNFRLGESGFPEIRDPVTGDWVRLVGAFTAGGAAKLNFVSV